MKRFSFFATLFLVIVFFHSFGFAQDDWGFQFRYKTDGKLYSFTPTGFSIDLTDLQKDVYRSFVGAQKSSGNEAHWGKSTYHSDSGDKTYYIIYDYDTLYENPAIQHLYDSEGLWLYSVSSGISLDSTEDNRLNAVVAEYGTAEDASYYTINKGSDVDYYMIDLHYEVLPQYLPDPADQHEYDEFALRIVLDPKLNKVATYQLFGNSTELRELHLMSPMFLK
ncbi:MAG: hypothetical protein V4604_02390 [Bacteroidota bacterium]